MCHSALWSDSPPLTLLQTPQCDSPKIGDRGCGVRVGEWMVGVSGQGAEGSGCLKVKGRAANWGGSKLMSFSVLSLPRTAGITSLSCQSTTPPPYLNQPTHLLPLPLPPFSLPTSTVWRKKKKQEKNCLFLNRPLNLFGLGVIGHLHGEHSEVSAITTGLWHPLRNMLSFR